MEKISVVIPTYNAEDTIEECLDAVLNQKFEGEIIVVDDHSTDKTPEILKSYKEKHGKVKILRNKENLGLAKTMNKGIEKSKYDYLCSLHADCILPEGFFKDCMSLFDEETAVVNSKVYLPKDVWKDFNFWNKLFFSKFLEPRELICEGKNDIWRKDILKELGMFSEDYRVAGEDFDLYFKMREKGYKLKRSNLLTKHIMSKHQKNPAKYFKKQIQYAESRGVILRKHGEVYPFNPFSFKPFKDWRLIYALPLVVIFRTLIFMLAPIKGLITGTQDW